MIPTCHSPLCLPTASIATTAKLGSLPWPVSQLLLVSLRIFAERDIMGPFRLRFTRNLFDSTKPDDPTLDYLHPYMHSNMRSHSTTLFAFFSSSFPLLILITESDRMNRHCVCPAYLQTVSTHPAGRWRYRYRRCSFLSEETTEASQEPDFGTFRASWLGKRRDCWGFGLLVIYSLCRLKSNMICVLYISLYFS
jgi:hypothetical protein